MRSATSTGSRSPLALAGFRWFFAARSVSLLGSSMAPVALAFAILEQTNSVGDLGIVLAANVVPLLGFMLLGGAIADRHSRKAVLLVANLGAGLTQAAVAILLLTGSYQLVTVAALEFLNGTLAAFTRPALRGIVPELVATGVLQKANSLLAVSRNVTRIVGPTASALLVAGLGGGSAIAIDAASYLLAAALLIKVSGVGRATGVTPRLLADLHGGWVEFRRVRWVWLTTAAAFLVNLVYIGPQQVLGPQLTREAHGIALWGLVLSAYGVGMLLSSVVAYRLRIPRLLATGQLFGVLGALILVALGLGAGPGVLLIAAFLGGVGNSLSAISWETSLQEHIRLDMLSRVSSFDELFSFGTPPGSRPPGRLTLRTGHRPLEPRRCRGDGVPARRTHPPDPGPPASSQVWPRRPGTVPTAVPTDR